MALLGDPRPERTVEQLLDGLRPDFRAILGRYRIPGQDAEDLLQDTLLTFLQKRERVRKPEAWILGTLRQRCRMYWRQRRRRLMEAVDAALLEAILEPEAPAQEREDLRRDLDSALSQISPRCQSLLRLRYRDGCEPAEAAERMGYSNSGIYKIIDRCLAALTRQMVAAGFVREARDA